MFYEYPKALYEAGDAGRVLVIVDGPEAEAVQREQGFRMIGDPAPEVPAAPVAEPADDGVTVESVRSQLDALGIEYDKRLGLAKLQALLPAGV